MGFCLWTAACGCQAGHACSMHQLWPTMHRPVHGMRSTGLGCKLHTLQMPCPHQISPCWTQGQSGGHAAHGYLRLHAVHGAGAKRHTRLVQDACCTWHLYLTGPAHWLWCAELVCGPDTVHRPTSWVQMSWCPSEKQNMKRSGTWIPFSRLQRLIDDISLLVFNLLTV